MSDPHRQIPRIDYTKLPAQWRPQKELPKLDSLDMNVPIGDKLPRIKVVVNSGNGLKSNR
jgi:hypothetical protein